MDVSRRTVLTAAGAAIAAAMIPDRKSSGQIAGDDSRMGWHIQRAHLMTRWSSEVTPEHVWPEYPRPQLVRDRWLNLNGLWNYQVTPKEQTNIPGNYAGI